MKYPKHDHQSVRQITPNIPTDIFQVLAQLCVPFRDGQQFSIHVLWLRSMALLFELCDSLSGFARQMCFESFSSKETLYRKANAIHNEGTLTRNFEFHKHPRKGLRQNALKGRAASRVPLTPLPLTCIKLFPGKHDANCLQGCQPGSRGRDLSAASAG